MYKPLALVGLALIDTATYSKFYQKRRKEFEIIDLVAERALEIQILHNTDGKTESQQRHLI